jgi:hypothetical protein
MPKPNLLAEIGTLGVNPMSLMKLMKYGSLKASDLTPAILSDVAVTLGLPEPSGATFEAFVGQLNADNVDTLADWLSLPGNFTKLREVFSLRTAEGEAVPPKLLYNCPLCKGVYRQ